MDKTSKESETTESVLPSSTSPIVFDASCISVHAPQSPVKGEVELASPLLSSAFGQTVQETTTTTTTTPREKGNLLRQTLRGHKRSIMIEEDTAETVASGGTVLFAAQKRMSLYRKTHAEVAQAEREAERELGEIAAIESRIREEEHLLGGEMQRISRQQETCLNELRTTAEDAFYAKSEGEVRDAVQPVLGTAPDVIISAQVDQVQAQSRDKSDIVQKLLKFKDEMLVLTLKREKTAKEVLQRKVTTLETESEKAHSNLQDLVELVSEFNQEDEEEEGAGVSQEGKLKLGKPAPKVGADLRFSSEAKERVRRNFTRYLGDLSDLQTKLQNINIDELRRANYILRDEVKAMRAEQRTLRQEATNMKDTTMHNLSNAHGLLIHRIQEAFRAGRPPSTDTSMMTEPMGFLRTKSTKVQTDGPPAPYQPQGQVAPPELDANGIQGQLKEHVLAILKTGGNERVKYVLKEITEVDPPRRKNKQGKSSKTSRPPSPRSPRAKATPKPKPNPAADATAHATPHEDGTRKDSTTSANDAPHSESTYGSNVSSDDDSSEGDNGHHLAVPVVTEKEWTVGLSDDCNDEIVMDAHVPSQQEGDYHPVLTASSHTLQNKLAALFAGNQGSPTAYKIFCYRCGAGPFRDVGQCPLCACTMHNGIGIGEEKRRQIREEIKREWKVWLGRKRQCVLDGAQKQKKPAQKSVQKRLQALEAFMWESGCSGMHETGQTPPSSLSEAFVSSPTSFSRAKGCKGEGEEGQHRLPKVGGFCLSSEAVKNLKPHDSGTVWNSSAAFKGRRGVHQGARSAKVATPPHPPHDIEASIVQKQCFSQHVNYIKAKKRSEGEVSLPAL